MIYRSMVLSSPFLDAVGRRLQDNFLVQHESFIIRSLSSYEDELEALHDGSVKEDQNLVEEDQIELLMSGM